MNDLIEVRASNLIGAALDWAVAMATAAAELKIGEQGIVCIYETPEGGCWTNLYQPSTDWSQGGLLIDTYHGGLHYEAHLADANFRYSSGPGRTGFWCYGPTALIAFCRGPVKAKLGDTVQVPKELIP